MTEPALTAARIRAEADKLRHPPPPPDEPYGLSLERTGFGGIRYYPYDCYETGHRRWHIYPAARNP